MNAAKINQLTNGGRVVLSSVNGITVAAERSGDGRTVRVIRETSTGYEVISTSKF